MTQSAPTLEAAMLAARNGNNGAARGILRDLLNIEPRNEQAYLLWADIAENPEHTRMCLESVLKINPNNTAARKRLASGGASASAPAINSAIKKFLNDEQDPQIVEQVHTKVSQILTADETIEYIAVQQKPVIKVAPDAFVLTNRRFIIYKPKLLGRVDFEDYIWRDLKDAKLKEGMMGATLSLQTVSGTLLILDYIPKTQARRLYAFAQAREEAVREERRMRELEDKRAGAGGFIFNGGMPPVPQAAPAPAPVATITAAPAEDPVQVLQKLKNMLAADLISQAEYDAKKAEILSRM